jgi:hypothetical protein
MYRQWGLHPPREKQGSHLKKVQSRSTCGANLLHLILQLKPPNPPASLEARFRSPSLQGTLSAQLPSLEPRHQRRLVILAAGHPLQMPSLDQILWATFLLLQSLAILSVHSADQMLRLRLCRKFFLHAMRQRTRTCAGGYSCHDIPHAVMALLFCILTRCACTVSKLLKFLAFHPPAVLSATSDPVAQQISVASYALR